MLRADRLDRECRRPGHLGREQSGASDGAS